MKVLSARIWWLLGAITIASTPLSAQHVTPVGVVREHVIAFQPQSASSSHAMGTPSLLPSGDSSTPSIGRIAVTVLGAGIGAFVGVASVEIYKQANGKSSCSCDHSADYTGAAIGALTFGTLAWWLGGKWFD